MELANSRFGNFTGAALRSEVAPRTMSATPVTAPPMPPVIVLPPPNVKPPLVDGGTSVSVGPGKPLAPGTEAKEEVEKPKEEVKIGSGSSDGFFQKPIGKVTGLIILLALAYGGYKIITKK